MTDSPPNGLSSNASHGHRPIWIGLVAGLVISGTLLWVLYPLLVPKEEPSESTAFDDERELAPSLTKGESLRPLGPLAFPIPAPQPTPEEFPAWWEKPAPLSDEEVGYLRFLADVSCDLPQHKWDETWNIELRKGANGIRFFASFAGYGAALYTMRLPAYVGLNERLLRGFVDVLLRRPSWEYSATLWKDKPWAPDPIPFENIMFTGHLIQIMAHYEAATGDTRYHTQGFDLVWDKETTFHYTLDQVVDITVQQMRENPSGGVPCEPANIFFSCNNHPHVGLKLLRTLGYTDYTELHEKWEKFALAGYFHKGPGGVVRFAYNQDKRQFFPAAAIGFDAWSVLWYLPWASDPKVSDALWALVRAEIRPQAFRERPKVKKRGKTPLLGISTSLYNMAIGLIPPMPTAAFLYAAAAAHGDKQAALGLKVFVEKDSTVDGRGIRRFKGDEKFTLFTTAAMATGVVLEGGADVRQLVQRPLPRDYFAGPLLEDVQPRSAAVHQAYRDGTALVVEVASDGPVHLALRNVATVSAVHPLEAKDWSFANGRLEIRTPGRRIYRIEL